MHMTKQCAQGPRSRVCHALYRKGIHLKTNFLDVKMLEVQKEVKIYIQLV